MLDEIARQVDAYDVTAYPNSGGATHAVIPVFVTAPTTVYVDMIDAHALLSSGRAVQHDLWAVRLHGVPRNVGEGDGWYDASPPWGVIWLAFIVTAFLFLIPCA